MSAAAYCTRCGKQCVAEKSTKPAARPFRKALKGFCAACAVCLLLQDPDGLGYALPPDFDPAGLKLPHIQAQFARVLHVGQSELPMDQIDWDEVIAKWNLPENQKGLLT
jgi:hypothetical protein